MPRYRFTARTIAGDVVVGERDAPDPDALLSSMVGDFASIESVQLLATMPALSQALDTMPLSRDDAAEIARHIAELAGDRLPLESGLAAIAAECPSRRVRGTLSRISSELARGESLPTVLARTGAPPELQALIQAGVRSGNTAQVLQHYVDSVQSTNELRHSLWLGLTYPLLLVSAGASLLVFMAYWVVPQFVDILAGFGIDLPRPTILLVTFSNLLVQWGWHLALGTLAFVVLAVLAVRLVLGRVFLRRMLRAVPVAGSLVRWVAMSRLASVLGLLVDSRIPLNEALPLAGVASGDAALAHDCRQVARDLDAGETLEAAAIRGGRLPLSFARMLGLQERTRGMPEVLHAVSDLYAARVRLLVAILVAVLPPLLMILLAAGAFFLVLSLFMPLIQLLNELS